MQDASETHGVAGVSYKLTHVARAIGGRALAVALTVALLTERPASEGSLPPGQVRAPLQLQF